MEQQLQEEEAAHASAKKKNAISDTETKSNDTETESNDKVIDNSPATRKAAKRKAIMQLWREKTAARIEKENEVERLVQTPVEAGPPKKQQVITHFFARELALERMKPVDSQNQRKEKGLNWYSKMKKSPEKLRIIRRDLQRQLQIRRRKNAAD
jgi:hypothetical protein